MAEVSVSIGTRVIVKEKDVSGTVAFVGATDFAPGKWIGLILDDPKGKNDGSVQGKSYFECPDKYGMFVRPNHIILEDTASTGAASDDSPKTGPSPSKDKSPSQESKIATLKKGGLATPSAIPKSRLPTPGSGPTGGRSPSFTNLKTKDRRESTAPHQTGLQRERSFVERNFVETLKQPQVQVQQQVMPLPSTPVAATRKMTPDTPGGSPSLAAQALSDRLEEKVANIQNQQELIKSREEIQDLKEKLETIKIKRARDQEKIKEYEKVRIQHDQLVEFKSRIMEAHTALQKELQKAKHEAREAIEAKERHAEEMAELSETVEMATLDKEMAEERAETLQLELDAAKDKLEELQLDLNIIKEEMGEGGTPGEGSQTTNFEMKQLQAQNEKLRETLVKMRDLSAHEKSELMKLSKDFEEKQVQNDELTKSNEKLKTQNEQLEATIGDLQEQVDAALGAEEMVENLTAKFLDLEEQYNALVEEKQDLEALHDMNEELQENAREMEMELREELDLIQAKVREAEKARNTAYEIIADHEGTIQKFRSLVNQVQDQNQALRDALEKETNKPVAASSVAAEMIDFKKMFAETKAHSRAIDMELRQCDVEESKHHVKMLTSFMSDNFMARGGDHEAILVLLLVPRMLWKISILTTQVKEKFVSAELSVDRHSITKGPSSSAIERHIFGDSLLHHLNCLAAVMQLFETALNTCEPQTMLRIGTLYPEMSAQEKSVDFYIELLRKDQLDENVPLDNLDKCLHYFQHIYPMHLGVEKIDHSKFLANSLKVFGSASDCLSVGITIAKSLSPAAEAYQGEIGALFKNAENDVNDLRQLLKAIKRRLPQQQTDNRTSTEPVIVFPHGHAKDLTEICKSISQLSKAFHTFGRSCIQQAIILGESDAGIPTAKLSEFLHHALDQAFEMGSSDAGIETVKTTMKQVIDTLTSFNKSLQDGEFDVDAAVAVAMWNTVPPILSRAETYKSELKDAETLKYKLENKELDIRDLKKALKAKSDEISEMQIRKDKAEKRLADATRDNDLIREKLQRKLDDAQNLLRRKEKEFEETLDHLQTELDSAENEKGELRNKLKETTKKVLLDGISRQGLLGSSSQASMDRSGAMSMGPSVPNPVKDSPMLLQHVQDLQMALMSMKEESYRKKGEDLKLRMAKLKPLNGPKRLVRPVDGDIVTPETSEKRDISKEETPSVEDLSKRLSQLRQKISDALVSKDVVELSKHRHLEQQADNQGGLTVQHRGVDLIAGQTIQTKKLELESDQLKLEIIRLIASKRPGGHIDTDFGRFPTPGLSSALAEKDYQLVGRVRIGGIQNEPTYKKVPLLIGSRDLHLIHQKVMG